MASASTVNERLDLYEVIDGVVREQPLMGSLQEFMANFLHLKIGYFALEHKLGHGLTEVLFDLTEQIGRKRRPDVAFVSSQRWPLNKPVPESDGFQCVPNLAVEIVSANNSWDEIRGKTRDYFRAGVERVWVISANQREAHVFHSPVDVTILSEQNSLSDPLLPGFSLPLSELFALGAKATEN